MPGLLFIYEDFSFLPVTFGLKLGSDYIPQISYSNSLLNKHEDLILPLLGGLFKEKKIINFF